MQELKWLKALPDQSLEAGVRLLNELEWNLNVREMDGHFLVSGGHVALLKTTSAEAVEAFLYGLAISYATLPKDALEAVRKFVKGTTGEI